MDLMRIMTVVAGEAARQQTDINGCLQLLQAYKFGYRYREDSINANYIYSLATIIDPVNEYGQYRRTPVTFANGGFAVDWDLIPTAMDQWFGMVNDPPDYLVSLGGDKLREYQVAEFLRIHPFRDGNGRIAWILRTRFYDNWESPDPLPKYFPGE